MGVAARCSVEVEVLKYYGFLVMTGDGFKLWVGTQISDSESAAGKVWRC